MIHSRKWSSCWDRCGKQGPIRPHSSSFRRMCRKDSLRKKMGEVTRKTEHSSSSAYGVRQHIKKNPLIQCAGQMFPAHVFTGNSHLLPSQMTGQLMEEAQKRLPCPPLLTGSNGNHTTLPRTPPAPAQATHLNFMQIPTPSSLITWQKRFISEQPIAKDVGFNKKWLQPGSWGQQDSGQTGAATKQQLLLPAHVEITALTIKISFKSHWSTRCNIFGCDIRAEEGSITLHGRCGLDKQGNPKPVRWSFSTAISRPWTGTHQPQIKYHIFLKLRYSLALSLSRILFHIYFCMLLLLFLRKNRFILIWGKKCTWVPKTHFAVAASSLLQKQRTYQKEERKNNIQEDTWKQFFS